VEFASGTRIAPRTADQLLGQLGVGNGTGAQPRRVTVSVVIPTLNESRNLPYVLPRIPSCVDDVVLVDGGSEDGTVEVARELRSDIRIVHEPRPGKGAALKSGFQHARGDIIVTLDADGSTDPAEIPAFLGCLLAGADFAKGSRFVQGGGTSDMEPIRKLGNWMLRLLVRIGFGGRYSDLCYGYNAMWRDVLPALDGEADGFEIETLLNCRALASGLRVAEVPSHERARIHGESHLRTFLDGARVLRTIVREQRACRRALRSRRGRLAVRSGRGRAAADSRGGRFLLGSGGDDS
jgi:glycosyltransferase involved in cell wall biosynthesis